MTVELIYDTDCPNVKDAREQLLRAFVKAGLPPRWEERDRGALERSDHVRAYGSPTILVNGQDVAGASPSAVAYCCRLYRDQGGRLKGIPAVESIASALLRANSTLSPNSRAAFLKRDGWRNTLAVLPAIGASLLPKLTCPACWPAYAGLLSSLGLGFVNYTPYLLPLTALFLILAIISLGHGAGNRRGYAPLLLGVLAATVVTIGKYVFASDPAMYGGIGLLMGASLWNSWPRRGIESGSCPACFPPARHDSEGITNKP